MYSDPIEANSLYQKNLIFDRDKEGLFINDLKNGFPPISSIENIEYHNFTTILSSSINKFSIEVLGKKKNCRTNP